jgi:hypothetical protein
MAETLTIGDAVITVTDTGTNMEGRTIYECSIRFPEGYSYTDADGEMAFVDRGYTYTDGGLKSGCQGGTEREGMESLLSFLTAAAEAYRYTMRTGRESDNSELFPAFVVEWAYQNDSELQSVQCMYEFDRSGESLA